MIVLRPLGVADEARDVQRFDVLAHSRADGDNGQLVHIVANPSDFPGSDHQLELLPDGVPARKFWRGLKGHFELRAGQKNEWTIPLPPELAQAVREALKTEKAPNDNKPAQGGDPGNNSR